ncbi:hypothetical protein H0H93_013278 [Arthromyces matolae]|nr:hypothetical protein H0H93_013278 [Arthromyces matolae]
MKTSLIRNVVVATCILLLLASPIPEDPTYSPESIDALSRSINISQDRSGSVPEPGTNSFCATTETIHRKDSTESELWPFKERGLHISDLAKRAGPAGEAAGEKADGHEEKSAAQQERLPAGVTRAPNRPNRFGLHCPELPSNLRMAYCYPLRLGSSAVDIKAVIKFLDDRANYHKEYRRLAERHKEETPVKEKPFHHVKPFKTDITEIEDKWALVRIMLNHKCYHLEGATELIEFLDHIEQSKSSDGTVSVTMLRPNTSLTSREKNPAPTGQGLASTAPRRRHGPQLPPNLKKAYDNPTSAEVDALKDVIKFLDERGNDQRKFRQISTQRKRETQGNAAKKPRGTTLVKTAIPEIADKKELKRVLARLVLTHQYYYVKGKTQMLKTLEEEEQSESTGSQQPNTSSSSHPVPFSKPGSIHPDVHGHPQLEKSPTGSMSGKTPEVSEPCAYCRYWDGLDFENIHGGGEGDVPMVGDWCTCVRECMA